MVLTTPVVLAPMAGITNSAFRTLCREQGAGLFVSEMVTARALIERHPETMRLITPGVGETPRSVQLYAVDPKVTGLAVKLLMEENLADHIDLNFGCPVPKVTRRGGGSALPFKQKLFSQIVKAAVDAAKPFGVPVTVKMRIGIDPQNETYLTAGKAAADAGVASKIATAAVAAAAKVPAKATPTPTPTAKPTKNSTRATVTGLKPGQKVKVTVNVKGK